jgi:hypothetical protein
MSYEELIKKRTQHQVFYKKNNGIKHSKKPLAPSNTANTLHSFFSKGGKSA